MFQRLRHIHRLRKHWVFKMLGWVWLAFGVFTQVRDNFFPLAWQERLATSMLLSWLPHWPWYTWVIGLLLILLAMIAEASFRGRSPDIDVGLNPSSGPSDELVLAVLNRGEGREFWAQCMPIALRNSPNALRRKTSSLKWEHTTERRLFIDKGESQNLLIATVQTDHKNDLSEMRLWGLVGKESKQYEWARWITDPKEKLPEYDLQITVLSEGAEPYSKTFTLRPQAWHGPLEMVVMGAPLAQGAPESAAGAGDQFQPDVALSQRIIGLSKELEQMLAGLGPRRVETYTSRMSAAEFMTANQDIVVRERKMEAMFERRFRQRVTDAYNEACETGTINDAELESILRTRRMDNDAAVRGVIERLKAVAAELFKQQ